MVDCYAFKKVTPSTKDLNLLILGGIHGDEIGTVQLAYDLYMDLFLSIYNNCDDGTSAKETTKSISYKQYVINIPHTNKFWEPFKGLKQITIIPNCNMSGIKARSRDQRSYTSDLNRNWDTLDPRSVIAELINSSDIVIDLHSSPDQCAGFFLLDSDMPNLEYILKQLSESEIMYYVQGSTNDTIKRYVNSFDSKLGFTWEQMGINYINRQANDTAFNILSSFIKEDAARIYWGIRSPEETTLRKEVVLGKQLVSNAEGIVIPGPSIINEAIYEDIIVDAGEEICRIESFDGKVLQQFYADDYVKLMQLHQDKWVNINDIIGIVQPM